MPNTYNIYTYISIFVFTLLISNLSAQAQPESKKFTISGYIKDSKSGEELIGATVAIKGTSTGTSANKYGFYSLSIPEGKYTISISFIGYQPKELEISLDKNKTINVELGEQNIELKEVVITSKKADENVSDLKMSKEKLSIEQVRKLPAIFGEVDILKTIKLLPGVQSAGEGTTGFFVRGGSADQNLILLDEAPVYNASHLLGFFSVFNADAIKDVEIYKGGIPSQYGGRLASILDIRMRDGNQKKISVRGGVGVISSRLTIEGPIKKDKGSFLISGRRTYADQFLRFAKNDNLKNSVLYFYDLNLKASYILGEKDRIFVSGYLGRDKFGFGSQFGLDWGNTTLSTRWNHIYNSKLFSNTTLYYSKYDYAFKIDGGEFNFKWSSKLQELALKNDNTWYANQNHEVKFGWTVAGNGFKPGDIDPIRAGSLIKSFTTDKNYALQEALYISDKQIITGRLAAEYGVRFSLFQNIGPGNYYTYNDGVVGGQNPIDTVKVAKGSIYNAYHGLEPRASLRYTVSPSSSIKASYNRTFQYLHLASSTTSTLPTDIWIASNKYIKPQKADQVAAGYFQNFHNNLIETSLEFYYKRMYNQIDFRDGANLLLNPHMETEMYRGDAWSYGAEVSVKKTTGKFTGWLAYTWSKTERQIPQINNGNIYPAKYDRRHNLVLVACYELTDRLTVSANFTYATGNAVTFPIARYSYQGQIVPFYSDRNGYRMPDYHRLDFAATYKNKKKEGRRWESDWNLSVYNVYNRKNAFSIFFRQKTVTNPDGSITSLNQTEAVLIYLFGVIPSITYNFKF